MEPAAKLLPHNRQAFAKIGCQHDALLGRCFDALLGMMSSLAVVHINANCFLKFSP